MPINEEHDSGIIRGRVLKGNLSTKEVKMVINCHQTRENVNYGRNGCANLRKALQNVFGTYNLHHYRFNRDSCNKYTQQNKIQLVQMCVRYQI